MATYEKPILLVGMMGAGKSALGAALAERLGLTFHDSDTEIERIAGKSVSAIFGQNGEAGFRAMERGVIGGLLERGGVVIAAGGGVMPDSRARTVWLNGEPEVFYKRIKDKGGRPKLGDLKSFAGLYETRKSGYAKAGIHVDTARHSLDEAVEIVLKALG